MSGKSQSGSSTLAVLISVLALLASIAALVVAFRTPRLPGRGIASYDLTTPQNAIRSEMEMEANGDVLARLELEQALCACDQPELQQAVNSLSFGRTFECEGKTLVLYQYTRDGKDRYEAQWLEKAKDGKYHVILEMPTWSWDQETGIKGEIHKAIREWEAKNAAGPAVEPTPAPAPTPGSTE